MTTYDKFYHFVPKDPPDMTLDELHDEMESCKEWERECVRIGQGINSKENIRERKVKTELTNRYAKIRLGVNGKELAIGNYGDITGEDLLKRLQEKSSG